MKIEIEVSEENEGTDSPWWVILDPKQNMSLDVHQLASQVVGPFFSRESAEKHLQSRRYAYSKIAVVYCLSGYWSVEYMKAYGKGKTLKDD